jgi:hypothetical protein
MSLINQLKTAILADDMVAVAEAFGALTGEKISPLRNAYPLPSAVVEALEFYADPDNWKPSGDPFDPTPARVATVREEWAASALGRKVKNVEIRAKGKAAKKAPKSPAKPAKRKKEREVPPEDEPPKRPEVQMVTVRCRVTGCGRTETGPAEMYPKKVDSEGNVVADSWVCHHCIKSRRALAE